MNMNNDDNDVDEQLLRWKHTHGKQPYDRAVSRDLCRIINFPITKFFKLLIDETTIETHNLPAKFLFYVFFY